MDEVDAENFDKFIEKHWGKQRETVTVSAVPEENTKRRGRKPKNI